MGGGALVLPEMGAYIGTASVTARSQRPGQIQIANTDLQFALSWDPSWQFVNPKGNFQTILEDLERSGLEFFCE